MIKIMKMYSPSQVGLGSFWGGPIASVIFLRSNFRKLGKVTEARNTLIYGILFIVVLLGILPFIPDWFPNIAIPLAYCLYAKSVAEKMQLKREEIAESEEYTFESNWKVFGIGTATLLVFLVIAVGIMFGLESLGLISLTE